MNVVRHTAVRLVTVLAVLVLAMTTAALAPARASQPRTHNDTRPVGSAPVEVDFPIEHFGIVADLAPAADVPEPQGQAPYGEVRFRVDGQWTGWQALGQDGAQAEGQFTGSLISVDGADAYQVRAVPAWGRNWRAAAINTSAAPTSGPLPQATATTAARCMSRADWRADESISGWATGDTQKFSPVQVVTVHHTATSNNPDQDYAATVRAIYSYHVQTNGWSDIGYQYLVDGNGVLYEGRSAGHTSKSCLDGGDGSDFGHQAGTDDIVTGAHVGNWNSGNIGISLIGCFDNGGGCTGDTTPPAAAVDTLVSQLGALSTRHGLDPTGTTHYVSPLYPDTVKDIATVLGHLDWGGSDCPGDYLYAQLPAVRRAAADGSPVREPATITSASCRGTSCSFTGTGYGALAWDFGNGSTAAGSSVRAKYTAAGSYPVALIDSARTTATRTVTCTSAKKGLTCTVSSAS